MNGVIYSSQFSYLFILIRGDRDEFRLLEDIRPEGRVRQLEDIVGPHQVEPRLVLVHGVQDRLRDTLQTL